MTQTAQTLYSVEQVANRLGLHVRTVRSYLRTGKLKGFRIGKQYRIPRTAVEALAGIAAPASPEPVRRTRHVDVSTIVQVDVISPESANRVINMLMASAKAPRTEDHGMRVDTTYDEERARLKVFVSGSMETTSSMLDLVKMLLNRG